MRKLILGLTLLSCSFLVASDSIRIVTGSKKGEYYKMGLNMQNLLKDLDYNSNVKKSRGSVKNFKSIAKDVNTIGFAQVDAYKYIKEAKPELFNKIILIGSIKKECAFLVTHEDGPNDDDFFQSKGSKLSVGKKGSGTEITFQRFKALENNFKNTTPYYQSTNISLANVASKEIDGALFVTTPKMSNSLFKKVNANPKLKFADIEDSDLNDKINGKQIYTFEDIDTKPGFGGSVESVCTTSALFANADIDEDLLDELAGIIITDINNITK